MYIIRALIAINIVIITASAFMMPLWAEFVKRVGGNLQTAGTAILTFSIVVGGFNIVAGKIESHFQRDTLFNTIGQIIMMFAYMGYFVVQQPWQLYLVQAILGLGGAFQAPALYALYHRYMPKNQETFFWGIWTGSYNISIGIGAFISAFITHHFGFNAVLSLLVAVAVFGLLLCLIVMKQLGVRNEGHEPVIP